MRPSASSCCRPTHDARPRQPNARSTETPSVRVSCTDLAPHHATCESHASTTVLARHVEHGASGPPARAVRRLPRRAAPRRGRDPSLTSARSDHRRATLTARACGPSCDSEHAEAPCPRAIWSRSRALTIVPRGPLGHLAAPDAAVAGADRTAPRRPRVADRPRTIGTLFEADGEPSTRRTTRAASTLVRGIRSPSSCRCVTTSVLALEQLESVPGSSDLDRFD